MRFVGERYTLVSSSKHCHNNVNCFWPNCTLTKHGSGCIMLWWCLFYSCVQTHILLLRLCIVMQKLKTMFYTSTSLFFSAGCWPVNQKPDGIYCSLNVWHDKMWKNNNLQGTVITPDSRTLLNWANLLHRRFNCTSCYKT